MRYRQPVEESVAGAESRSTWAAELTAEDIEISKADLEQASELVAVCRLG